MEIPQLGICQSKPLSVLINFDLNYIHEPPYIPTSHNLGSEVLIINNVMPTFLVLVTKNSDLNLIHSANYTRVELPFDNQATFGISERLGRCNRFLHIVLLNCCCTIKKVHYKCQDNHWESPKNAFFKQSTLGILYKPSCDLPDINQNKNLNHITFL